MFRIHFYEIFLRFCYCFYSFLVLFIFVLIYCKEIFFIYFKPLVFYLNINNFMYTSLEEIFFIYLLFMFCFVFLFLLPYIF